MVMVDLTQLEEFPERVVFTNSCGNPCKYSQNKSGNSPDDYEKALAIFRTVLTESDLPRLVPGEPYFLVSEAWINKLKDSLDHVSKQASIPDAASPVTLQYLITTGLSIAIDNSDLIQETFTWGVVLRENVTRCQYKLVTEHAWQELLKEFGGGPEIKRFATATPDGDVSIDVVGIVLRFATKKAFPNFRVGCFSSFSRLSAVVAKIFSRLGMSEDLDKVRVWEVIGSKPCKLLDLEVLLCDADLDPCSLLYLEVCDENGDWELDFNGNESDCSVEDKHCDVNEQIKQAQHSSKDLEAHSTLDTKLVGANHKGPESDRVPGLLGLYNLCNSCYMNSTLQCLSSVPKLRNFFLSGKYLEDVNKSNPLGTNGEVSNAFSLILEKLWNSRFGYKLQDRVVNPKFFKTVFDKHKPSFAGYSQEDAQEYLSVLLDSLHEDCNRSKRVKQSHATVDVRDDRESAKAALAAYHDFNESIVSDLFVGMLASKVTCMRSGCGNTSITFDPYSILPLPIDPTLCTMQDVSVVAIPYNTPLLRKHFTVTVPAQGPILLLRKAISSALSINSLEFFLAETASGKILRLFRDDDNLNCINDASQVTVFENPESALHISMLHGEFYGWLRLPLQASKDKLMVDESYVDLDEKNNPGISTSQYSTNSGGSSASIQQPACPYIFEKRTIGRRFCVDFSPSVKKSENQSQSSQEGMGLSERLKPFTIGQMWVGAFETLASDISRVPLRVEIVSVQRCNGNWSITMLLDISRISADRKIEIKPVQETVLVEGVYSNSAKSNQDQSELFDEQINSSFRSSDNDDLNFRQSKSTQNSARGFLGSLMKKLRSSATPFNVSGDDSLQTTVASKWSNSDNHDEACQENPDDEASSKNDNNFEATGRLTAGSHPWCILCYEDGRTCMVPRQQFEIIGVVDIEEKVMYGSLRWTNTVKGIESISFYLRLVSETQYKQFLTMSPETDQARRLQIGSLRALRYMSVLTQHSDFIKKAGFQKNHEFANIEPEKWIDPGIIMVRDDCLVSDLLMSVLEHFSKIYNTAIETVDESRKRNFNLPNHLSALDIGRSVRVLRAARNYVIDGRLNDWPDEATGVSLSMDSTTPAFGSNGSKLLIRRVVLVWNSSSPIVRLFTLFANDLNEGYNDVGFNSKKTLTVYDCFDLFCRREKLGDADGWRCSKCKGYGTALKELKVWMFPPVVVLHLKRFVQNTLPYKIDARIGFPTEKLDLSEYCVDSESAKDAVYDLCAVIAHYGSMASGHYIAFARHEENGKWYEYDDDKVAEARQFPQTAISGAYVLFYIKHSLRPASWSNQNHKQAINVMLSHAKSSS